MTEQPSTQPASEPIPSPVNPSIVRSTPGGVTVNAVLQAALQIGKAADEIEIFDILNAVLEESDCECTVYDLSADYIRVIYTTNSSTKIRLHFMGTSVQVPGSPDVFGESDCLLLTNSDCPEPFERLVAFYNRLEFQSLAIFPVWGVKRLIRLIGLGSTRPEPPARKVLNLYRDLATITSQGLQRVDQIRSLQSRLEGLETLADMNQSISAETELFSLYKLIHQRIGAKMGADLSFAIAIYHPNNQQIHIPYLFEGGKLSSIDPIALGEGLTSHILNNKESLLLVRNIEAESKLLGAKVVGKTAKSWLGVPLILMGQAIGAIIVQDLEHEGRFIEKDRLFLETLAPQLAIAIRNAQLLDEMNITLRKYDREQFLLNSLLENIPEKVYFKDTDGQYLRASRSWIEQLPASERDQFYGKTDLDLFADENGLAQHEWDSDVIDSAQPSIGVIEEKKHSNGETTWEWISRIPLLDGAGRVAGLLGISQDITDLKNTELISRRRAQQLQTASEIARDTTGSLEPQLILKNAVNLIRQRFDFYHASVFLIDSSRRYAVLEEASGKIGETMKKIGHRLEVGSSSLVGQATAQAKAVVVNDTLSHLDYYPNPLLPETRSEIVVPLKIGLRVLGALDVQSNKINAFSPEDTHTLEILADQLAIALENANLFSKTQDQITKQKLLRQLTTAASSASDLDEALQKIVASLHESLEKTRVAIYFTSGQDILEVRAFAGFGVEYKPPDIVRYDEGVIGAAASQRRPVLSLHSLEDAKAQTETADTHSELAVPIQYLDELLGVLSLESPRFLAYDENDQEMVGSLGDSIGVVIANIRLLIQIRTQMELQEKLFDISGRIRQSVDVDTILRTTAQEIGERLGFSEVVVELIAPDDRDLEAALPQVEGA